MKPNPQTISPEKSDEFLLDTGSHARARPTYRLRRIIAYHSLKAELLGSAHNPNDAQAKEMVEALESFVDGSFDSRTLLDWSKGSRAIQLSKLRILDEAYCLKTGQRQFLLSIVLADYVSGLNGNQPLHMHLAAIDAACYFGGGADDDWSAACKQTGLQILQALQSVWTPNLHRQCSVFTAVANDSDCVRAHGMRSRRDQLDAAVVRRLQYVVPTTVPIFLAALAADQNFLTPDRIERWAFDLASATAALYAVCHSDRHAFALMQMPNEAHLIAAMRTLFWQGDATEGELELQFRGLIEGQFDDNWNMMEVFLQARSAYSSRLHTLGVSCAQIDRLFLARDRVRRTTFTMTLG